MWREYIEKMWKVDPLTCPKYALEMKIISFIYQHKVIRKILGHLKIYEETPQLAPPVKKGVETKMEIEPFDDG